MKISTEIGSISKVVGEERAVELCGKAGFDGWDFSMFNMHKGVMLPLPGRSKLNSMKYLRLAKRLRQIGRDNGIVCNQSHAPFPVRLPAVKSVLKLALECTAEAGGEFCIIHPDNNKTASENAEMYHEILPFAKECGVKIATEYMWNWNKEIDEAAPAACSDPKSFCDHIDVINDEFFVACLDLGHAEMKGLETSAVELIHALDYRLQALHIHDNDRWHDSHQIPFSMDMDFEAIAKALSDIGYSGYLTLEADRYLGAFNEDNVFEGIKKLFESVKRISDLMEE